MFIALLIISVLSIAGSAAFFSVYGLAQIFSGAFWAVIMMGGSLEAGKLMAASYTYRYWNHIGKTLKAYLISAIVILMIVTSVGIFGFLSAAYQKDILPLAEMEEKIVLLTQQSTELDKLKSEKLIQRQRLVDDKSKEIAALPSNYATKKKEVAERYQIQLDRIDESVAGYEVQVRTILDEKQKIKLSTLQQEIKTGPIVFIAEAVGKEVNNATTWLIIIIIFAFDPLAVALTIGVNIALVERQSHKRRRKDDRIHVLEEALDTHEKPSEPTYSEMEQVVDSIGEKEEISVEHIREVIEEMSSRELNPVEKAQKQMLEEMLRRKTITENVRNPKQEA